MTIPNLGWTAVGILVGVVIAGLTLAPSMAAINDGLTCLGTNCEDLAAQRSMAVAAWAMVLLTAVATSVAIATMTLVLWTLDAAKRSARAAEEVIGVTREIGMLQIKAYLAVSDVTLEIPVDFGDPELRFSLFNSGQSPGRKVRLDVTFAIPRRDMPFRLERAAADVPSQSTSIVALPFKSSIAPFIGANRFEVRGTLRFQDVAGREETAEIAFGSDYRELGYGTMRLTRRIDQR